MLNTKKAVKKLYTSQPSYQMQNIRFCQVWACPESKFNFQIFPLFLLSSSSAFSCLICFLLLLVVFNSVGKIFGKAFRILKLDERRGRWVVQQDSHGNFWPNVILFFAFFSGLIDWIVLIILVWFERSPHPAWVTCNWQTCLWLLRMITSQVVQWISMGGSGTLYSRLSRTKMASLSWVTTHPYHHAFTVQKFRWLWCSQPACQIFNRTGYIFDLWIFGI